MEEKAGGKDVIYCLLVTCCKGKAPNVMKLLIYHLLLYLQSSTVYSYSYYQIKEWRGEAEHSIQRIRAGDKAYTTCKI